MTLKTSPYRRILIILTLLVILMGGYFGVTFYNASQKEKNSIENTTGRQPAFQTRPTSTNTSPQININNNTDGPGFVNVSSSTVNTKKRLIQLWNKPVSGFDFIYKDIEITSTSTINQPISVAANIENSTTTSTGTRIFNIDEKPLQTTLYKKSILKNQEFTYFWDRGTGHIYENLSSSTVVARIANNTMPRVQEVFFLDGNSIVTRHVAADNETIIGNNITLFKESATSTIFSTKTQGVTLFAKQIAVLPEIKKIFLFLENSGKGVIINPNGSGQTGILNTSLKEWLPQYVNKNIVALTTRPSAYFPGYLFFVKTDGSGNNEYILGEKYALTTLVSPDNKKVLYSEILNDQLETSIYDVTSKTSILLSQATLADKCAWDTTSTLVYCAIPQQLPAAPYPDAWYQNQTKFSDNIWSINPETGEFNIVVDLQNQLTSPVDAYNIKISKTKKYLLFQDRYSLTLWRYEL